MAKYLVVRLAVLSAVFMLIGPSDLRAAKIRVLQGHVPAAVANLAPVDRLPRSQRLDLALGLPLRNRDALTNFLRELYDPASPQFRQYLTPEQFTELFGPSASDYQQIKAFARANGLTVTRAYPNRVVLDVNATVDDIEKAFHITMRLYQHPTESRIFYAPDREPTLDSAVPLLDISGLDNFNQPHPLLHKSASRSPAQPAYGSGLGGTYMGKDFRAAYAPNVAATGLGQAVGLLEFDGYYASDITAYETQAGLPNVPLKNVLLDNFNGTPGSGNVEVALDIEMAIALAPGLNQVIVYEAGPRGNPNDILSRMANDNLAKQLSSSWTWSGGPNSTSDSLFQQLAAQGQSFFQAAGDSDAYTSAIPQPADDPYITIVGGTTLMTTGPGGSWASETTWNWFNSGVGTNGTGGGISASYSIPAWQQGISMSANQGSTSMRNIPDVALTADNVWVTYNNGSSGVVAGTSCAAPLWAAFTALINQQALANGKPMVGFINPAIYSIGKGIGYSTSFHDITTGNNTNNSSPTKFFAVSGLDLCTGWGTPTGGKLIDALAGAAAPQIVSNSLVLAIESCPNQVVDPGEMVTMNFGLVNLGSASTTNLVATLQPTGGISSPSAAQNFGVLTAGGPTVTRPFTFTAGGVCGGILTATLQLNDGALNLGTVTFNIQLGNVVTATTFSENFDGVAAPVLPSGWTSVVISGIQANWVTTNGFYDTAPNSAFVADALTVGESVLVSPIIPIVSSSAQLAFRHNYNLAWHTTLHPRSTSYYDGGVLEISIGGGAFADIIAAGGSFVTGGYNCRLSTATGNPLSGSQAWGGSSGGWINTTVNLPAAAVGQNIQLRWSCGTGINTSPAIGWFVDTVSVQDSSFQCCAPVYIAPTITTQPTNLVTTVGGDVNFHVTATGTTPLCYQWWFNTTNAVGVSTNTLTLTNALPGQAGGYTVTITNTAGSVTSTVATLTIGLPPSISQQPSSIEVVQGQTAAFNIAANGDSPLSYVWRFNGTPIPGATSTSYTLAAAFGTNSGNYDVLVTNAYGEAASTLAKLTVLVPPSIVRVSPQGAAVSVSLNSVTGLAYQLQYKNSLNDSAWTAASSWVPGTGALLVLQDTNAVFASRFYRIDCQ